MGWRWSVNVQRGWRAAFPLESAHASPKPMPGARAAAMVIGTARVVGVAGAVILTAAADSAPRPDWIAAACRALESADVVAGRIVREGGGRETAQARIEAYYDRMYALRRAIG